MGKFRMREVGSLVLGLEEEREKKRENTHKKEEERGAIVIRK